MNGSQSGARPAAAPDPCAIVELRRYTLHPGARERLIALFDREFIETQEAAGMRVIGQFRDLDAPDNFVWLRGFSSMEARKSALTNFYGGPAWAAHSGEANATMIDFSNVFLLRPTHESAGFKLDGCLRPQPGNIPSDPGHFALTIYHLKRPAGECFLDTLENKLLPKLSTLGAKNMATLITEASVNTFPRLPIRDDEEVLVSVLRLNDSAAYAEVRECVLATATAKDYEIIDQLTQAPEVSHLTSTGRSLLR